VSLSTGKPKLLMLVQLPPPVHGVSVANKRLVDHPLLRERFEVRVLALNPISDLSTVGRIGFEKLLHNFRLLGRLVPALRWADAVYITPGAQGLALRRDQLLTRLCQQFKRPYVLHHHCSQYGENDRGENLTKQQTSALQKTTQHAAGHLLLGDSLRSGFEGFLSSAMPTVSVENGVPIPASETPEPNGPIRLGFLGNLIHYKGFTDALAILARLPGIQLEVVGGFTEARYKTRTMKLLSDLDLEQRVHFHGPHYGEDAWSRLADTHLLLFTSNWREGLPLVWLESLARGLPVLSTDIGMAAEVLAPIDPRMVQSIGDHEAFASAVRSLTEDGADYTALRQRCRRVAVQKYSTDAWVERMIKALDQLLFSS
jgi:glycosyltransferase involved in cell wall biosynthesis